MDQAERLKQRNRELKNLNQIAKELNRSVDLEQTLHAALAQVAELLGLETGWVWLLREETGESYLAASQNLPPGLKENPRQMEGPCYCLETYRKGDLEGAANVNMVKCSRLNQLVEGTGGLSYHASIPLYAGEKKLGVLNAASSKWRELSRDELRLLYTIGDLLSIAVERARLYNQSVQLGTLEERNRLAREIHDTLAQGLSATVMQLETADALMESGSNQAQVREIIDQALRLTRENLREARRSVMDLRAAPLQGRSLADALSVMVADAAGNNDVEIEFQASGGSRPLSSRIEVGLYRIAQEAVSNILQHADAGHALVELVTTPAWAQLVVEDDGDGFEPGNVAKDRFGLIGIQERAKLLGGTVQLESSPGLGTRVEVQVPLEGS